MKISHRCCLATLQPNSEAQLGKPLLHSSSGHIAFARHIAFPGMIMTGSLLGRGGSNFANDSNSHVFLVPSTSPILVYSEEESKILSYRECY